MNSRYAPIPLAFAIAIAVAPASAQEARTEYRLSLTDVYGAYQSTLARREACGTAFPQSRAATDKAYAGWQARHRKLIDELDQRFNMLIRSASKDEKDYTRNIGKYEGALLRQRDEAKQALLQLPRNELELECKGLPDFLQSADSDLEKEFAEQLTVVRKRPLARR
jgi:predicted secreted protein